MGMGVHVGNVSFMTSKHLSYSANTGKVSVLIVWVWRTHDLVAIYETSNHPREETKITRGKREPLFVIQIGIKLTIEDGSPEEIRTLVKGSRGPYA